MRWRHVVLFLGILLLDVSSKRVVMGLCSAHGSPCTEASILSLWTLNLSLTYMENRGMAFGLLPQLPLFLCAMRLFLAVGLLGLAWLKRISPLGAALISAGAFGNALDVISYGHVVDWIAFSWAGFGFPVFNIADSMIILGAWFLLNPCRKLV